MSNQAHWNTIYTAKRADEVSWFAPRLDRSLAFIAAATQDPRAQIIDVGAGESTLAKDLLAHGYRDLTLVDISDVALTAAREQLGEAGKNVRCLVGDITTVPLPEHGFDVWHDRAVFHFLLGPAHRAAYAAQVRRCVRRGGHVIIATFSLDGPAKCSGLPVARYGAQGLSDALGEGFELMEHAEEMHTTPSSSIQKFTYCRFRRS